MTAPQLPSYYSEQGQAALGLALKSDVRPSLAPEFANCGGSNTESSSGAQQYLLDSGVSLEMVASKSRD
jgi:hypothetical protein